MTIVLKSTATRMRMGVCSASLLDGATTFKDAVSKKLGYRREYLWDYTLFRKWKEYELPSVIIEHENSHGREGFLLDFWKLMLGFAPLRVMVGYVSRRRDCSVRFREMERVARSMEKPQTTTDLVLIRSPDMKEDKPYFLGWERPAGQDEWEERSDVVRST